MSLSLPLNINPNCSQLSLQGICRVHLKIYLSQLARETCLAECEAKLTECLIECNSDISCTSSCNREYAQCEHRGRQFWLFILFKNVVETSRRNCKGNEGHDSVKHQCQTFHFNFVHWNFSSSRKIFNMF